MKFYEKADKSAAYALALSIFCILILSVRLIYTGKYEYIFLSMNLFLAWVPYAFSILLKKTTEHTPFIIKLLLFVCWLMFFPNAAYITTDMYHLFTYTSIPLWFDLLMLLSFSWAGLVWGFLSMQIMLRRLFANRSLMANVAFISIIFLLTGVGIYLGRYERWNSWDILFDASSIYRDSIEILSDREKLVQIAGMSLLYCGILSFLYYPFVYVKTPISKSI
jgi:uncharacterized membrane protein